MPHENKKFKFNLGHYCIIGWFIKQNMRRKEKRKLSNKCSEVESTTEP